jgi:flagellar operon protein (TIGR03826 family)
MPDVRNCRRCGHIFNYIGGIPICPTCKGQDEEDFKRVKSYLWDNPGATLSEVSTVLEITVEKIKGFLKEGRLEIIGGEGNMVLECEKCGKAIKSGRLCDDCTRGLSNELRSTAKEMSAVSEAEKDAKKAIGMRYLNKDGK